MQTVWDNITQETYSTLDFSCLHHNNTFCRTMVPMNIDQTFFNSPIVRFIAFLVKNFITEHVHNFQNS